MNKARERNLPKVDESSEEIWRKSSVSTDRRFHIIEGRPLYRIRFDEVMNFHEPGFAPVRSGDEWFHVRQTGERAYQHSYTRVWGFYSGLAAVNLNGESFHIREDGFAVYKERYLWVGNFQEELCAVRFKSGRYGHIHKDGHSAYDETYRYVGDYRENSAVIQLDNGMHIHVDHVGVPLNGEQFIDLGPFHKGIAPAKDDGGWFHINESGNPLYERRFSTVEPFYNGVARVQSFPGGIETINEQGKTMTILREEISTPLQRVSDLMVSYWKSSTLHSAIELGIFEMLPASTEILSKGLSLTPGNCERLMRALWELDLVGLEKSVWIATETGSILKPNSLHELSVVDFNWSHLGRISWDQLTESLKTGVPGMEIAKGEPFFAHISSNEKELKSYNRAMQVYADHDYWEIPNLISTVGMTEVADVGCGYSNLLFSILNQDIGLSGILFDKPETISKVNVPSSLKGRVKKISGDIFEELEFTADLVILTRVLHDWDYESARAILERVKYALNKRGTILVVEMVLEEQNPKGALADLNLLATCGGHERSLTEWKTLFSAVSLEMSSITKLKRYGYLMELHAK